jgi:hypothetical protein
VAFLDARIANAPYTGWSQSKLCQFGTCVLDISTFAQHPGVPKVYIYVETVNSCSDVAAGSYAASAPYEKPTNYQISATIGTANCAAFTSAAFGNGFCSNPSILGAQASASTWVPLNANYRHQEAQCLYNTLSQCECLAKNAVCNATLQRFACLQFFRTCDSNGFWTPVCRQECLNVYQSCSGNNINPFFNPTATTCSCQFPQFLCQSNRYQDNQTCTGSTPTPNPTSTPTPVLPPTPPTPPAPPTPTLPTDPPFPTFPPGFSFSPNSPFGPIPPFPPFPPFPPGFTFPPSFLSSAAGLSPSLFVFVALLLVALLTNRALY